MLLKSEINWESIQIDGTSLDGKRYLVANNGASFYLGSIATTTQGKIVICSANSNIMRLHF